jgi:hypothetical protein
MKLQVIAMVNLRWWMVKPKCEFFSCWRKWVEKLKNFLWAGQARKSILCNMWWSYVVVLYAIIGKYGLIIELN